MPQWGWLLAGCIILTPFWLSAHPIGATVTALSSPPSASASPTPSPTLSPTPSPTPSPSLKITPSLAPIVLDGRILFEVSDAGTFKAKERAELVNRKLTDILSSSQLAAPPTVRVEERDQQQTLLLNDSYLLTVTNKDTPRDRPIIEQADIWADIIRRNLQTALQQRSSAYIQQAIGWAIGLLLGTIGLHYLIGQLGRQLERRTDSGWSIELLTWAARVGLWVSSGFAITNLFPRTRQWSYELSRQTIASFAAPILTLGKVSYSLSEILLLSLGLVIWIIGASIVTQWFQRKVLNSTRLDRGAQEVISTFLRYLLIGIGALVLLQVWGVNISSLAILASALGLGIGFGLQELSKNISGGFVLLFERLVQVGDYVEIGEYKGTIERIGARSTQIKTLDNAYVIVPNVRFLEKEVINWSYDNRISRIHIPITIAQGTAPETLQRHLLEIAQQHPAILAEPQPQVTFKGFSNQLLNFELLVWSDRPDRQGLLISDLNYQIYDRLQMEQIPLTPPANPSA
jgi:potassium-dependent mechanosensitive channel